MLCYCYNFYNNFLYNSQKLVSFILLYFIIKKTFLPFSNSNRIKYNNKLIKNDDYEIIKDDDKVIKNNDNKIIKDDDEVIKNDDEVIKNDDYEIIKDDDYEIIKDNNNEIIKDDDYEIIKYNKLEIINNCYNCKKNININNLIFCFDSKTFCKIICRTNYIKSIFISKYIKHDK